MTGNKQIRLLAVVIVTAASVLVGCTKSAAPQGQTQNASVAQTTQQAAQDVAPPSPKILTKDPDYLKFLTPQHSTGPSFLKAYSDGYRQKMAEIDDRVAKISDDTLRDQAYNEERAKVNDKAFEAEADKTYSDARREYLAKHRDGWFEIGHCKYDATTRLLHVSSVPAAPLGAEFDVPIDLVAMDEIYKKFRLAADPRIRAEIEKIIQSFVRQGASREAVLEDWRAHGEDKTNYDLYEGLAREREMIVAAQGDFVARRVDRLFIVDYGTETILAELDPKVLARAQPRWKN